MSRKRIAYFAIVGTLAFALPGAASAGQVNIPHINIPRPQISIPTPHPSVPMLRPSVPTPHLSSPKLTTPNLVSFPKGITAGNNGLRASAAGVSKGGTRRDRSFPLPDKYGGTLPENGTSSSPGSASAMPYSNTGGGSYTSSGGGGYSTVGKANGSPSLRCRSKGDASNCS
jgi:hypothetical protein